MALIEMRDLDLLCRVCCIPEARWDGFCRETDASFMGLRIFTGTSYLALSRISGSCFMGPIKQELGPIKQELGPIKQELGPNYRWPTLIASSMVEKLQE
ncbi:hypothetical protein RRG08_027201 [Elysia crispata]|uniref:Uncharacterized protein n=1 Tax=Elysia crispata TaxID=231223 RepID=A0AAE1DTE7_9GAST|nr:hypothetical protein RRG08_027201 [Elysia crispata]